MSEGNNGGRPPLFKTAEDMQESIDQFFAECTPEVLKDSKEEPITDKHGRPVIRMNPPTITGLALHLGFASRQSIYDYEKTGEFSYTIKKAKLKCENFIEKGIYTGEIPPASGIFGLKNYGWSDQVKIDGSISVSLTLPEDMKDE